jgi:hypothetical protein
MKTLFTALFGIVLLASSGAWAQTSQQQTKAPGAPEYPGSPFAGVNLPAICNNANGIVVIVIEKSGDVTAFACERVRGNPIRYEATLPPGFTDHLVSGSLGRIDKWGRPGDTDPCYEWTVNGESHIYCW